MELPAIRALSTIGAILVLGAGCSRVPFPATPEAGPTFQAIATVSETAEALAARATEPNSPGEEPSLTPELTSGPALTAAYTYQRPDGNRWISGRGSLPEHPPLEIELASPAVWLVAAPFEGTGLWVTVSAEGRADAFLVGEGSVAEFSLPANQLPPGSPPMLLIDASGPRLLAAAAEDLSPMSHPVPIRSGSGRAYLSANGDLWIGTQAGGERDGLSLDALPDGRLLTNGRDRLLVLSGATGQYDHGVLGDALEATRISLADLSGLEPRILHIPVPEPLVIEGLAPIWADLTGDGRREIVVTASDRQQGARLLAFDETGALLGSSAPIGIGFRWRHQIAVAPLGPDGEPELVSIRTPHIGGVVEYFRLDDARLQLVAELPGYSSHLNGSRNLDMAAVGDFDGDGRLELLTPDQSMTSLHAIRRTAGSAQAIWSLDLQGTLTSNLAGITLPDGQMQVGAATSKPSLLIWGAPAP